MVTPNTSSAIPATPINTGELAERFSKEHVTRIAKSLGVSYKTAWNKVSGMGLKRERPTGFKSWARDVVRENFHDHSITEMARMAKVCRKTIIEAARELGLRRTPEEKRAISSRIRREMLEKERIRANWGFPPKTKLKVFVNHKKSALRYTMTRFGYILDDDDRDTLYYESDLKRHLVREEHGREMGLRFLPLPDDYWDDDDDDDDDIEDDNDDNEENYAEEPVFS